MNNLYLIKSGDNGFVEETSAVISAEGGDISINSSLHVDSAGNIGIGSSNPTNKLDVVGSASISNDLTVDNIIFTNVGGQSPSAANDIIKYDGNNWVVAAASTLPGGGGGAGNSDVPAGLITNLPQGTASYEVNFGFDSNNDRIVYDNVPKIAASLEIDGPGEIIPHTISGVSESGYHVVFSEELPTANYRMHTVFGGTDAFWETGVANLEYSERNVEIDRSLYVGQKVGIGTTSPSSKLLITAAHSDTNSIDNLLTLEAVEKSGQDLQPGDGLGILFKVPVGNNETSAIGARIAAVKEGGTESATSTELVFEVSQQDETLDEAMRIDRDGNVGIGTTSPTRKLHIYNNTTSNLYPTVENSTSGNAGWRMKNSNGDWVMIANSALRFYDVGQTAERMRIDSDGNVGIGTTNPADELHINSAGSNVNLRLTRDTDTGGRISCSDGADTPAIIFETIDSGSLSEKMRIKSGGNVGIGTTNPAGLLHLESDGPALYITDTTNNTDAVISSNNGGDIILNADLNDESGVNDPSQIQFKIDGEHVMRIKSNGNVGIGTTSPTDKLHIYNNTTSNLYPTVENSTSGNAGWRMKNSNGDWVMIANSALRFYDVGQTAERMRIDSDGNVGIGTTNPADELHINSAGSNVNLRLTRDTDTGGRISCSDGADTPAIIFETIDSGSLSEKMRIKSDGNVGIGTTDPSAKLEVLQSSETNTLTEVASFLGGNYSSVSNAESFKFFHQTTSLNTNRGVAFKSVNGSLQIQTIVSSSNTSASNNISLQPDGGNVGIGTKSPSGRLDISSSSTNIDTLSTDGDFVNIRNQNSTTNNFSSIGFFDSSNELTSRIASIRGTSNGRGSLAFINGQTSDGAKVEMMRIDSDGKVGIGTKSPSTKLHVEGVLRASVTDEPNAYSQFTWGGGLSRDNGGNGNIITTQPALIMNRIDQDGDGERTVTIHSDNASYFNGGNVGIGTTDPAAKLDIHTTGASAWGLKVRTDNGDADSIKLVGGGGDNDVKFLVKGTGDVGIGTTDPGSYKLYINGTARVSSGDVTSDDRVKHNEQPIVGALETLSKITPKKYIKTNEMYDANHDFELDADGNPIDENGEPVEHHIEAGVIAQQVLTVDELAFAVSPEGVDEDGNVTSPHGLDYNSLFTYAIAAIQEQQAIIEDLKSRIETLEQ